MACLVKWGMTATFHHWPVVELDRRLVVLAAVVVIAVCGLLLGLRIGHSASPVTSFETPDATATAP